MLKLQKVKKSYGRKMVLDQLDLEVENGTIFGITGGAGAGKTTLCRMIAGLIPADEGKIMAAGEDMAHDPENIRKKVGYVPKEFGRYRDMDPEEYLDYYGRLYGLSGEHTGDKIEKLLEMVGLAAQRQEQVEKLKLCEKKRLALARCFLKDIDVLVLDDFLVDLDPRERKEIDPLLFQIRDMGKAVLISSPGFSALTGEEESLGILQEGKIVVQGSLEEISEQVNCSNPLELVTAEKSTKAIEVLKEEDTVTRISIDGHKILAGFQGTQEDQVRILKCLMEQGVPVVSFQRRKSDLESVFWKMTE